MKKPLFILTLMFFAAQSTTAQYVDRTNFRGGLNAGLVLGDYAEFYSLVLGVDIYHHWGISREIDLGLATGFSNAFGEKQTFSDVGLSIETKFDNVQFIPVAGSLRIYPAKGKGFKFGGDVGYAFGINAGNDGGLYYRPVLAVDMNGGSTEFNVSYQAVNGDTQFASVLAGFLFLF